MSIGGRLGLNRFTAPAEINLLVIDYSIIISLLNSLTNSSDTVYEGIIPPVIAIESILDDINGEVITI